MITVHKGNPENTETFRLILTCDECQAHVKTDVPLDHIRNQGHAVTEFYLARARLELGQSCPHIREEWVRQEASQQDEWSPVQRRSSYMGGP